MAIDAYGRSLVEGDVARVAAAAAVWGLVFGGMNLVWRVHPAGRAGGEGGGRAEAGTVLDARGTPRRVAFVESAGLLAGVGSGRALPDGVRADVRKAGLANVWTEYRLPSWRVWLPAVGILAGLTLAYGGAAPPPMIYVLAGMFVLLGEGSNPRPARMAEAFLRHAHCPGCGYGLRGVPRQEDGCTVCPECGAAWRVPWVPG
jgi:hypothetical protein